MQVFLRYCVGGMICLFAAQVSAQSGAIREENVTFRNGGITLAGTLALPKGPVPHPAVVLLSGDGQQDRDWTFGKLKMAKVISDRLAAKGIAVLRFDDRGEGGSTGVSETQATFQDRCNDARAAIRLLRGRPGIGKIGLCGHSGGAIIAGMTAAQDTGIVDFVITISGPFITGEEVLLDQARTMPNIYRAPSSQPDSEATREGRRIGRGRGSPGGGGSSVRRQGTVPVRALGPGEGADGGFIAMRRKGGAGVRREEETSTAGEGGPSTSPPTYASRSPHCGSASATIGSPDGGHRPRLPRSADGKTPMASIFPAGLRPTTPRLEKGERRPDFGIHGGVDSSAPTADRED